MKLNERASRMIRSLMRDLQITDHILSIRGGPVIISSTVLAELEAPAVTAGEQALAAMQEFCDRVERGEVRSKRTYAKFKEILALPHVGDGSGDAALAIAEHAFRAGHSLGYDAGGDAFSGRKPQTVDDAWDAYDPPEDIKALS